MVRYRPRMEAVPRGLGESQLFCYGDTFPMTTIGATQANTWQVEDTHTDLTRPRRAARPARVAAQPKDVVIDLSASAMIVIDMQNRFCHPAMAPEGDDRPTRRALGPLARLLPALRGAGVPVLWVNWGNRQDRMNLPPNVLRPFRPDGSTEPFLAKGSWEAEIDPLLVPEAGDIHVDKYRISGFPDTPLDSILRNLRVTTLLFAGVNLDQCVYATLVDASCLGYDCVLVEDCAATGSPEYCTQATIYNVRRGFGFVVKADDVIGAVGRSVTA
jgi:ureidoacrylate peracid hydrolase